MLKVSLTVWILTSTRRNNPCQTSPILLTSPSLIETQNQSLWVHALRRQEVWRFIQGSWCCKIWHKTSEKTNRSYTLALQVVPMSWRVSSFFTFTSLSSGCWIMTFENQVRPLRLHPEGTRQTLESCCGDDKGGWLGKLSNATAVPRAQLRETALKLDRTFSPAMSGTWRDTGPIQGCGRRNKSWWK